MATIENVKIRGWGWWLLFGLILIIIGLILLTSPVVATLATVFVFGSLLIAAGIIHLVTAFLDRNSNHFWLHIVIATFSLVIGALMLFNPTATLLTLTLLIAAFFLSSGLIRIIGAIVSRFKGWGWYLLNGLISLLLGALILFHWPVSSLWVIGLFMGVDFLFAGISLLMISLFAKK